MNNIEIHKTTELSEKQIRGILSLFKDVFNKEKSREFFYQQALNTPLGYSFHCVYSVNDTILAYYCIIPYQYRIDQKDVTIGLSIDTMIRHDANAGPFLLYDMASVSAEYAKNEGISFLYGFPNDNAYQYVTDILEWQKIGDLDFYILPLAVGRLKKGLSFLNFLRFFSIAFLFCCKCFSSTKEIAFAVEKKDSEAFRKGRYDSRHHFIKFNNGTAFYTLYQESFGMVAYIIDINPISARNFFSAFLAVALEVKDQAGLIAYPSGRLPFGTVLRLPRALLPRKLHLVASGMNGQELPEVCKEMRNWRINLSDFDVR